MSPSICQQPRLSARSPGCLPPASGKGWTFSQTVRSLTSAMVAVSLFAFTAANARSQNCGCPASGNNLVQNSNFECPTPTPGTGTGGLCAFTSQYAYHHGATMPPGRIDVCDTAEALAKCGNQDYWKIADHTTCDPGPPLSLGNPKGRFLVVNGRQMQAAGEWLPPGPPIGNYASVWQQTIQPVAANTQYTFCAHVKNLPSCCFDIKPTIQVRFRDSVGGTTVLLTTPTVVNVPSGPCNWQQITALVTAPSTGTLVVTIELLEWVHGDGNDLAIDDIWLCRL